jgi:acetyltransferase-like isoleucine patch superfamily enzyme
VLGPLSRRLRLWGRAWRRCLTDAYEQEALRERFPGVSFGRGVVIRHAERFYPGHHVILHDLVYLNCAGSAWNNYQGFIRIGDYSELAPFVAVWGAGEVTIGVNVHIGDCTTITAHASQPVAAQHEDPARPLDFRFGGIFIEDHVIIGSHVTILPGVRIGRHAMIGAGSVVTADVAPSTLVAGAPARLIRELS